MKKFWFIPILIFIVIFSSFFIQKKLNNSEIILTPYDTYPKDQVLLENTITYAKGGDYYAYVVVDSLMMDGSAIWVDDSQGVSHIKVAEGSEYRYLLEPFWSPDGNRIAYIKIYPFELWVVDKYGTNSKLVYSESENENDNKLNPSIGYQGTTFLEWLSNEEIVFENNRDIPSSLYSINTNTLEINFHKEAQLDDIPKGVINPYSQRDTSWENISLGTCSGITIGSAGCAITATSMMLDYYGIDSNPELLNEWLTKNNTQGYFDGCDIRWNIIPNISKNIKLNNVLFNQHEIARLDYELSRNNVVIVGFNSVGFTDIPHWVLVSKKIDNNYIVYDPWLGTIKELSYFGTSFDHMIVYSVV